MKRNDRIWVSGSAKELWISGFDCNIATGGTILETPDKNAKKITVILDEINHQKNVKVDVCKSKIKVINKPDLQKEYEDLYKKMDKIMKTAPEDSICTEDECVLFSSIEEVMFQLQKMGFGEYE